MPYFIHDPHLRLVVRTARTLGYAACAVAGGIIIAADSPDRDATFLALGVFCLVGGALAALGTLTGRWVEELLGLPLLSAAMFTLSLMTAREDMLPADIWAAAPRAVIPAGFGILLLARFVDVYALSRVATFVHHRERER